MSFVKSAPSKRTVIAAIMLVVLGVVLTGCITIQMPDSSKTSTETSSSSTTKTSTGYPSLAGTYEAYKLVVGDHSSEMPSGSYLYVVEKPAALDYDLIIAVDVPSSDSTATFGLYYIESIVGDDGVVVHHFLTSPTAEEITSSDLHVQFREADGSSPILACVSLSSGDMYYRFVSSSTSPGSSTGGQGSSSSTSSPLIGKWTLAAVRDYDGNWLDFEPSAVSLTVLSADAAVFYFYDNDPYPGTLSHDSSRDAYYSSDGFESQAYRLTGSDGEYWEFAFVTPKDGGDPFWYLEVGPSDSYKCLYLAKESSSGTNATPSTDASRFLGVWTLVKATDYRGSAYDLGRIQGTVSLTIRSADNVAFYYFDGEPYQGSLVRYSSRDSYYQYVSPNAEAYKLVGADGSYWELAFVWGGSTSNSYWYLEVGEEATADRLFLARS